MDQETRTVLPSDNNTRAVLPNETLSRPVLPTGGQVDYLANGPQPDRTDNQVPYGGTEPPVTLPAPVVQERASKWDTAMASNGVSPGHDAIAQNIADANTKPLQIGLKAKIDSNDTDARFAAIQKIAELRGGPLSSDEIDQVEGLRPDPQGRDLDTIMEQEYAHAMVSAIGTNQWVKNQQAVWAAQYPDGYKDTNTVGTNSLAKLEIHQRLLEEYKAKYEQQGFGSRVWQSAKEMLIPNVGGAVPFSQGSNTYGANPGPTSSVFSPGRTADQWNSIYSLGTDSFEKFTRAQVDAIWQKNPADAVAWLQSGFGSPLSDQITGTAMELSNFSIFAGFLPKSWMSRVSRVPADIKPMTSYTGPQGIKMMSDEERSAMKLQKTPFHSDIEDFLNNNSVLAGLASAPKTNAFLTPEEWAIAKQAAVLVSQIDPEKGLIVFGRRQMEDARRNLNLFLQYGNQFLSEPKPWPVETSGVGQVVEKMTADANAADKNVPIKGARFPMMSDEDKNTLRRQPSPLDFDQVTKGLSEINRVLVNSSDHDPLPLGLPQEQRTPLQLRQQIEAAIRPLQEAVTAARAEQTAEGYKVNPPRIMEAAGDLESAARLSAEDDVMKIIKDPSDTGSGGSGAGGPPRPPGGSGGSFSGLPEPEDGAFSRNGITGFLNPATRYTGASNELRNVLMTTWSKNASSLADALLDTAKIQRLSDEALQAGFADTMNTMRAKYPRAQVIDWRYNYGLDADNPSNLNSLTAIIGNRDLTYFQSEQQARTYARLQMKLADGNYEIKQNGAGWAIEVSDNVDETAVLTRARMLDGSNAPPVNVQNMLLGSLRSSKDITSADNSAARNVATHGAQFIQSKIKEAAKEIGKLNKEEYNNLRTFFERDNQYIRPDGSPGRYFDDVGSFSQEYFNQFAKQPSDRTVAAYFTARQMNDFDYLSRNLAFQRDMGRQNATVWKVRTITEATDEAEASTKYSPDFYGKQVYSLPSSNRFGILVIDENSKTQKYYRNSNFAGAAKSNAEMLVREKGYKIVQVVAPIERPLKDTTGYSDFINFIVTKNASDHPIGNFPVPYNPGGHIEYAPKVFTKQPIVSKLGGRFNYEGDRTIFSHETEAEAQKYVASMEEGRRLYNQLDTNPNAGVELNDHLGRTLPYTLKEFVQQFRSTAWDAETPFMYAFENEATLDRNPGFKLQYGDKWHSEADSPYNLMNTVDKKFLGTRDPLLQTIKERGTNEEPQYVLDTARTVDPYVSLTRTVTNVANQRLLSDYKIKSAEDFIQFIVQHDLMASVDTKQLQGAPLFYMQNPVWSAPSPGNSLLLASAKANRLAVLNFLNMNSPDIAAFKWFQNKILNTVYDNFGQKASDLVAENMIPTVNDPFKYARNIAFYSKLGMGNPIQFINQMQTLVHVVAVSGATYGWHGVTGMTFGIASRLTDNPEVLQSLAQKFSKVSGWTPAELLEARSQANRSGFFLVQGETSWRQDVADPSIFSSLGKKILDAGTLPFREGERNPREAAWYSAYKQWRDANPDTIFDDKAMSSVLARADTLTLNMTRASSAPWEGGPIVGGKLLQLMGQFGSYQIRLFEQLWGSRLTPAEKARVIGTYAVMYGVPVATGAAVGFWPMYDSMKTSALERGQDWDTSLARVLMEGLPSYMIEQATGKQVNYAERFGTQGLTQFRDLETGDKKWYQTLMGVSGQTVSDLVTGLAPVFMGAWYAVTGQSEKYPLVANDAVQAFKTFSTVNALVRAYYAINYGKYLAKSGQPIADADKMDALLSAAFGLTSRQVADMYRESTSMKVQKEAQELASQEIASEMHQAFIAASNNDASAADDHIKRAQNLFAGADLRPDQWDKIAQMAGQQNDLLKKIKYDFFIRNAPQSQVAPRAEQYPKYDGNQ